jgi:hypothetical protein
MVRFLSGSGRKSVIVGAEQRVGVRLDDSAGNEGYQLRVLGIGNWELN